TPTPGATFLCRHQLLRDTNAVQNACLLLNKCPPAEKPCTPILCESICHSASRKRTVPTVLCASSNASGEFGYGPDFRYPECLPALHMPSSKRQERARVGKQFRGAMTG